MRQQQSGLLGSFVWLQMKDERKPRAGVSLLMAGESHPPLCRKTAATLSDCVCWVAW